MLKAPLSEQLRPEFLQEVQGQDHLVGDEGLLTKIIKNNHPISILLWGPPGSGKTTIAKLYAKAFDLNYHTVSPIHHGIQEIKKILESKNQSPLFFQKKIILFVDEIHRFNKAQQDLFLPCLEDGSLILIAATTENPSFAINNALLSRMRTLVVNPLGFLSLEKILNRYLSKFTDIKITDEAKERLIHSSQGDARYLFNLLENSIAAQETVISIENLDQLIQRKLPNYDKNSNQHYDLISALHKSIRGSDPQATLYYLNRMLIGGEDPNFIGRRFLRIASEDIGLADPQALTIALNCWQTFERLGSPEGDLALAQCAIYLALSPKSNRTYLAYKASKQVAENSSFLSPPHFILNASSPLMKTMGYAKGYVYDHDTESKFSGQDYFPTEVAERTYYEPDSIGFERELLKRMNYFNNLKK